jgi:hypothetical protein
VLHINADGDGLTKKQHRATLELFQSEIAPVLRREIPSRPFPLANGELRMVHEEWRMHHF